MKLKALCQKLSKQVRLYGDKEVEVTGLCTDSRRAVPGNLFIARRGVSHDGNQFIEEAYRAGCVAILTDLYDPTCDALSQIVVDEVDAIEAEVATLFYANPSKELLLVGITGTDGKTTSSYLTRWLLEQNGYRCGLIGTIEYLIGDLRRPSPLTTPDLVSNHKMMREMLREGCNAAVMEVSSHGIQQGRLAGLHFDVGLLTNLASDHLDYHGSVEAYRQAKASFFQGPTNLPPRLAILNGDDSLGKQLLSELPGNKVSYGFGSTCDLRLIDFDPLAGGRQRLTFEWEGKRVVCRLPLMGCHNSYNGAGAIAVALSQGISIDQVCAAIEGFPGVPGRLEQLTHPLQPSLEVYIDYAHTPRALEAVLNAVRRHELGRRLTVVFGCGGNRDRQKRPKMAQVAEELADRVIVTSDNPRHEEASAIIAEICTGFSHPSRYKAIVDRREAIHYAIATRSDLELLLIAGKGHEKVQLIADCHHPFDDSAVAHSLCCEDKG